MTSHLCLMVTFTHAALIERVSGRRYCKPHHLPTMYHMTPCACVTSQQQLNLLLSHEQPHLYTQFPSQDYRYHVGPAV